MKKRKRLNLTAYKIIGMMIKENLSTINALRVKAGSYNIILDRARYNDIFFILGLYDLIIKEGNSYILTDEIIELWVKTQRYYEKLARFEFELEEE